MVMYHEASRALQDAFGSRELADRLEKHFRRSAFTEEDAAFIASLRFFFLATANAEGQPDCSFKGGDPGFVRVLAPDLLAFPDYDGNGMFKSLGNIRANPHVGLLFIAMEDRPKRLRVNGTAEVVLDDPLLSASRARRRWSASPRWTSSPTARETSRTCSWWRRRPTFPAVASSAWSRPGRRSRASPTRFPQGAP